MSNNFLLDTGMLSLTFLNYFGTLFSFVQSPLISCFFLCFFFFQEFRKQWAKDKVRIFCTSYDGIEKNRFVILSILKNHLPAISQLDFHTHTHTNLKKRKDSFRRHVGERTHYGCVSV